MSRSPRPGGRPGGLGAAVDLVARPRVDALVHRAVADHRVTAVSAPAGFAKTTSLRAWAQTAPLAVAWARLDPHRPVAGQLLAALRSAGDCDVLVLDDLDRPLDGTGREALRDVVLEGRPNLRIVLSGRSPAPLSLARLALSEGVGSVTGRDLAFTKDEIADLATSLGRPMGADATAALQVETGGWPAAVRTALATTAPGHATLERDGGVVLPVPLADYVQQEVLDALPAALAAFVLRATSCSEITGELATLVQGDPEGARMLRECVERGVFLEQHLSSRHTAVHRWNPALAAQCRAIFTERHPDEAATLHRRIAAATRAERPAVAADLALRAGDPALAADIVSEHWIQMMLEDRASALETLARSLPMPWSELPETLLVRACCRRAASDDAESTRLQARARRRAAALGKEARDRFRVLLTCADLLLADDADSLGAASDRAVATLTDQEHERPALYASVLLLAGFAEMRLRRDGANAVSLLRDASTVCHANGLDALGHRATSYAAFVLAYEGDFETALASVAPGTAVAQFEGKAVEGAIELTRGFVGYWQNDLDLAGVALEQALVALDEPPADPSTVCMYLALIAVARGGRADLDAAERWADRMVRDGAFGMPWGAYRKTVEALIAERRGELEQALAIAASVPPLPFTPVISIVLAALQRRGGDVVGARARLDHARDARMPYARAHAAVVEALIAQAEGDADTAHLALERALGHADPQRALRCFAENARELHDLLADHAEWGTDHERLVATLLNDVLGTTPAIDHDLSRRELEVLRYMRTRMTATDIAGALHISTATVKTHQRAIYRKLAASNRREALRIALARGLV